VASPSRTDRRIRLIWALSLTLTAAAWACGVANSGGVAGQREALKGVSRWGTPAVFTPAHSSAGAAVRDFFGVRPPARQPLEFSHQLHLSKGAVCTDCHVGVEQGPVAGLPSVPICMICHSQIATDRPLIQQITQLSEKGRDLEWQRVYGWAPEPHVRFEHAPHIRAKVECTTCHGNLAEQTVAERAVEMDMAFCVNCHKGRQASNDCLTCHF
jgi:hypothetical protein